MSFLDDKEEIVPYLNLHENRISQKFCINSSENGYIKRRSSLELFNGERVKKL